MEQTLLLHLQNGGQLGDEVTARTQTRAAQGVGRKNLSELEGLSVFGAQLTKLVLGLGRVFEVLAAHPLGHTPEVNEFELGDAADGAPADAAFNVAPLLTAAVMHLALLRQPGTKVSSAPTDTRDYDYRLHPVFSAFFLFSHRRKRKLTLTERDIDGLVHRGGVTIAEIVRRQNREMDEDLPDQLNLFSAYFRDAPATAD